MLEEGLKLDPLSMSLKLQLDATTNSILKDLLEGAVSYSARDCALLGATAREGLST